MYDEIKDSDALSPEDQRALAALRTDFNVFTDYEVNQLIIDGYTHARSALRNAGFQVDAREPFKFFPSANPTI
jgi:hypothetical protein